MRRAIAAAWAHPLGGPVVLLCAGWLVTVFIYPWNDRSITDMWLYAGYGGNIFHGYLPYRDFPFEYPPLSAPLMALPALVSTGHALVYEAIFAVLMLGVAIGSLALCARLARMTGGNERRAAWAFALLPLALGALTRERIDLVPVALVLIGLVVIAGGRTVTGGFTAFGLGAMTKAFPILAGPPAFVWLWTRGQRANAIRGAAALAIVMVAIGAVTYAVSPSGARYAWDYQVYRPIQSESAPAIVLQAVDVAGGPQVHRFPTHNSDGLTSGVSDAVGRASSAVIVAAVLLISLLAARGPPDGPLARRQLVLATLSAIAAAPAFGKVLSPQFMIWVWPLFALAVAWGDRVLAGLMFAAMLVTFVEFPFNYFEEAQGQTLPVLLVALRDTLLIAALVTAVARLARRSARREEQLLDRGGEPVFARLD